MKDAVDPEFAKAMVALAAAFSAKLEELTIRVYARALADVPPADLRAACARAVREWRGGYGQIPTVADLRGFLRPSVEDAGLLAWAAFGQAASAAGAYASVEVEDGAAAEALIVTFGSWAAFCAAEDGPALGVRRQEFLAAYRNARRRPVKPARLAGLCEASGQYPAGALAEHVWVGRIADGRVELRRDRLRLGAGDDGHERAGLPEGRGQGHDEAQGEGR